MLTKSLVRNALLVSAVGVACVAAPQVGCSSAQLGQQSEPEGPSTPGGSGTVGMRLTLPGGAQLNTVSWAITGGPTGATASNPVQSGTVNVTNSLSVAFSAGGLAAGSNYVVTLTGVTTNGATTCSGSATFSVQAQATTSVTIPLACSTAAAEAGSAQVSATTYDCATVQSLSAVPTEVIVGNPIAVSATATGPNPGALSYAWSAPAGTGAFSTPSAQTSNFTCSSAGPVTLTVTVTDGAVPAGSTCPTSTSTTVNVTCAGHLDAAQAFPTATKIKHLVVIFNENNSFDHYWGTYPTAQNNSGEPYWAAAPNTPVPNNLIQPLNVQAGFAPITGVNLLTNNPTVANSANGSSNINPVRLAPTYAETSSQNHSYSPEQQASDKGIMDLFPKYTGTADTTYKIFSSTNDAGVALLGSAKFDAGPTQPPVVYTTGLVMAYYDGNTLGTYWNWAQQYALNDNMWTTDFGPSSPGAINVVSGQTNGLSPSSPGLNGSGPAFSLGSNYIGDGNGGYTIIGDFDPAGDACEGINGTDSQGTLLGTNIGMLLNGAQGGITWGWFQGGFNLNTVNGNGSTGCTRYSTETVSVDPAASYDYVPHHNPFQMYPATQNLTHARPTSTSSIGYTNVAGTDGGAADPANHLYDSQDFFAALTAGNLPAVVYLKPPAYQNGHPGNSDPIDEQAFASSIVTALQNAQEWSSSLVVITYDDSDGWYDHQGPPIVNESTTTADLLNSSGVCNSGVQQTADGGAATTMLNSATPGDAGTLYAANGRCAYGTRVPMMVISPFAKTNYIDHTLVDQSSVVKFIEDNWLGGQRIPGSFDAVAGSIQNMLTGD
jgi:phospholipase C